MRRRALAAIAVAAIPLVAVALPLAARAGPGAAADARCAALRIVAGGTVGTVGTGGTVDRVGTVGNSGTGGTVGSGASLGLQTVAALHGRVSPQSPAGPLVVTRGVVTVILPRGFFLQDPFDQGDPDTPAGLFVFTGAAPAVAQGDGVEVAGRLEAFTVAAVASGHAGAAATGPLAPHWRTELSHVRRVRVLAQGCSVAPREIAWPLPPGTRLASLEGALVRLHGPLTVEQSTTHLPGPDILLGTGGRHVAPTQQLAPGPAAAARAVRQAQARLPVDLAGLPGPLPRAGDTLAEIVGVIDFGRAAGSTQGPDVWRLRPAAAPAFVAAPARPAAPPPVAGDARVASANLQNFFVTLADGLQGCGPARRRTDCRGARDGAGFARQQERLAAELAGLDADVIGLMEVENQGAAPLRSLLAALAARAGPGVAPCWAAIAAPPLAAGADAIQVALIYRCDRVRPVGPPHSDPSPVHLRPPLAQAFSWPGGRVVTVIVSHFKSRRCDGATGADLEQRDGQGCHNARRVAQADALLAFAARLRHDSGIADALLIGDFNAYAQEAPLVRLRDAGWVDRATQADPAGYSYVHDGESGRLDHAFASPSLAPRVAGVVEWHINADEPAPADDRLRGVPWRASDHDPLLVGLRLEPAPSHAGPPATATMR